MSSEDAVELLILEWILCKCDDIERIANESRQAFSWECPDCSDEVKLPNTNHLHCRNRNAADCYAVMGRMVMYTLKLPHRFD